MRTEYSAGVVIFYKEKRTLLFLLLQYERQTKDSPYWDLPKGHIEKGESRQETALRELKEETGLEGTILPGFQEEFTYYFKDPKTDELVHKTVYFFIAQAFSKNVQLSFEHSGYEWLTYRKAVNQLTYKNAKELLKKVYEFLKERK